MASETVTTLGSERPDRRKPRLLVFIVAFNAERTIESVLGRIPARLQEEYDVEVLVIDDSSQDETFARGEAVRRANALPFALHVLFNPVNQGYGGNQKIGFEFALERGFEFVALVHGDGQYAPECLPDLVRPLADGAADAVFGSRMLGDGARAGGMPLYKFVGNKVLTAFQNRVLGARLSEFHSGYRVYSVDALRRIPFDLNTNDFHFDTEIIIQLLRAGQRIRELPIPTYYGEELCHVNGLKYAWDVAKTTLRARTQDLSLLYDRKFDCGADGGAHAQYVPKLEYDSPHRLAVSQIEPGSRVLDLGCGGGHVAAELRRRGCRVTGVDLFPPADVQFDEFHEHDLDAGPLPVGLHEFDYVLLLDVIEHLASPERFMDELREAAKHAPHVKLFVSTGNVGFALTRAMLLLGQFNYGKRGILDLTHTRLFTFSTLRRLLEGARFEVLDMRPVPAPFPLALGEGRAGRLLLGANRALARVRGPLFAYQAFATARPRPSLDLLLRDAYVEAAARSEQLEQAR